MDAFREVDSVLIINIQITSKFGCYAIGNRQGTEVFKQASDLIRLIFRHVISMAVWKMNRSGDVQKD